jgi:tetratricopeptide (TPR) repeat protein
MSVTDKFGQTLVLLSVFAVGTTQGDESPDSRTVIGPSNIHLSDGAQALLDKDGEEGVRLTLLGLRAAQGQRERKAALANLCAGYLLLNQVEVALDYCNKALAESDRNWQAYSNRALVYIRLKRFEEAAADVVRGQELAPNSRNLKIVKGMLLDETRPVSPSITIDDRRDVPEDEG